MASEPPLALGWNLGRILVFVFLPLSAWGAEDTFRMHVPLFPGLFVLTPYHGRGGLGEALRPSAARRAMLGWGACCACSDLACRYLDER